MSGPPRAMGPLTFLAYRSIAADLPEDFVSRIESGLDDETMARIANGVRRIRDIHRLWRWTLATFIAAAILLLSSGIAWGWAKIASLDESLLIADGVVWMVVVACVLATAAMSVRHRADIRRVMVFVEAMRRSSLARDLA